mmetsp:Transcript_15048/g.22755  ORF Transcript_15048/g.22755 Transcript_15048/m.22755 type:complete len:233 (+) Transcript_15048:49-747(+)
MASRAVRRFFSAKATANAFEVSPKNIYCVGRNYMKHVIELGNQKPEGEPIIFHKSLSSIRALDARGGTSFSDITDDVHHEVEVVLKLGKHIPLNSKPGWESVSALGLGLDLTRRGKQIQLRDKGLPWTLAKSFQGATILSPFQPISNVTVPPPYDKLAFRLLVNGEEKQMGEVGHMLFDVPSLLTFLATYQEMDENDIIFTGTPDGVGPIMRGDTFELEWVTGLEGKYSGML